MGAIGIHLGSQTTIGGGVQRTTTVTLPGGLQPAGDYWLGVKISTANNGIARLTLGTRDILALGRNTAVQNALARAYPIPDPTREEWWGFEVPAGMLPPLYPNFQVHVSLYVKLLGGQNVPWHVVQKPGPFNTLGVREARGISTIA